MPIKIEDLEHEVVAKILASISNAQETLRQKGVVIDPNVSLTFNAEVIVSGGLNAINRTEKSRLLGESVEERITGESVTVTEGEQDVQKSLSVIQAHTETTIAEDTQNIGGDQETQNVTESQNSGPETSESQEENNSSARDNTLTRLGRDTETTSIYQQ